MIVIEFLFRFIRSCGFSISFVSVIRTLQSRLRELKTELHDTKQRKQPITEYLNSGLKFLWNLNSIYENSSYENKRAIIGAIFPEKLRVSKEMCRTTELNTVVELLCRNNGSFEGIKKGANSDFSDLSPSVPGAGLEPARPRGQQILSLSCLPIPPSGHRPAKV